MNTELKNQVKPFTDIIMERKAEKLIALDVRKLTSYTDFFIICSGKSTRQVSAIAEYLKVELKKTGKHPLSVDGLHEGQWALLDYGNIIIHIFQEDTREFYDLEGLWSDADIIQFN